MNGHSAISRSSNVGPGTITALSTQFKPYGLARYPIEDRTIHLTNPEFVCPLLTAPTTPVKRVVLVLVLLALPIWAFGFWAGRAKVQRADVLRLKGLIIEDAQGRPRILLGAPTPTIAGRVRNEPVDGFVLLGPNAKDRIVISYPGYEPQVQGKIGRRTVALPSAGLVLNDSAGNERAGFGVSDDGSRVTLGLDYADRDALGLIVSPGFSGFVAFARAGERNDQAVFGVEKDGNGTLKLANSSGDEAFLAEAPVKGAGKLMLMNHTTHRLQDVSEKLTR